MHFPRLVLFTPAVGGLSVEGHGSGVATTFARPEKLNALTFGVLRDLHDLVAELPRPG